VSIHLGRLFEGFRFNSFEWVVQVRSFEDGMFDGMHVNSFGQVIRLRACLYQKF